MQKVFSHNELWQLLKAQHYQFDVVIVGGGITGAGIFRQAAMSGYKTLLIEQQDYSWGTSSRSSKMVHGGFRYIAQGDIQLTKEALHEREQMLREVPGLVDRETFVFPLRKGRFPGRFSLTVLLKVYDLLAGVHDCEYLKNEILADWVPGIDKQNTKGAVIYSDAITDDSRLVMRVLQEGKSFGGMAINYCKATQLFRNEDGHVERVQIENQENREQLNIACSVLVNATGAWADNLMHSETKKIRPLRGSHLVLDERKFPITTALTLIHPDDGRPVFMFPWFGRILLGTTDLDYPENLDIEAAITDEEIEYLLKIVNEFFPDSHCDREDIVSTFCGVRPVISSGKGISPSKEKRGHSIWKDRGLISVSGGKLTIFRVIADEVMQEINIVLKQMASAKTERNQSAFYNIFNTVEQQVDFSSFKLNPDYQRMLSGRYGSEIKIFLEAYETKDYQEFSNYRFSLAECRWALDREQVVHLDDLFLRRTRLGLLDNSNALLMEVAGLMAAHYQWSESQLQTELKRYQKIKADFYSLPSVIA